MSWPVTAQSLAGSEVLRLSEMLFLKISATGQVGLNLPAACPLPLSLLPPHFPGPLSLGVLTGHLSSSSLRFPGLHTMAHPRALCVTSLWLLCALLSLYTPSRMLVDP